MNGLEKGGASKKRLGDLRMFSLKAGRQKGHMVPAYRGSKRGYGEDRDLFSSLVNNEDTSRGNEFKTWGEFRVRYRVRFGEGQIFKS